jgi:hypothetical protein
MFNTSKMKVTYLLDACPALFSVDCLLEISDVEFEVLKHGVATALLASNFPEFIVLQG